MKTEEVIIDGKKETIIVGYDPSFEDDRILNDDLNDTMEISLDGIQNEVSDNE